MKSLGDTSFEKVILMNFGHAFLFFTILITSVHSTEKIPLRICKIDTDFSPFTKIKGLGIWQKKVFNVAKDLPVDIQFHEAPRKRCLFEAKENVLTDAIIAGVTDDKKNYLSFPMKNDHEFDRDSSIGKVHLVIVVNKDSEISWDGEKFSNLGNGVIGIQHGFQVDEKLDSMKIQKDVIPSAITNIEKLNLKRINGAIMVKEQFENYKKKHPLANIVALPIPFISFDMYLGFSTPFYKKNKNLVDAIWANLKNE